MDVRKFIKSIIQENFSTMPANGPLLGEDDLDEERISNKKAAIEVNARRNFVGSHTYGEDLGGFGKMYVAYSYGQQHPLYVWVNGTWYHNTSTYLNDDGTPNTWAKKHLVMLRPNMETQGRPGEFLTSIIDEFKRKHNIPEDNSHTDLEPGEK